MVRLTVSVIRGKGSQTFDNISRLEALSMLCELLTTNFDLIEIKHKNSGKEP